MKVTAPQQTIVRWAEWASSVVPVSLAERETAQEATGLEVELFGSPTALINGLFERRRPDGRLHAYPLGESRYSDWFPVTEMARSVHKDALHALNELHPQPDIAPWYPHCYSSIRTVSRRIHAVKNVLWEREYHWAYWYASDFPWRLILLNIARERGLLRNESLRAGWTQSPT